jgi:hypothetical protein
VVIWQGAMEAAGTAAATAAAVARPRRRIGVLGSSKTVHRYAERLRRTGAETRAVEVLEFRANAQAVAEAVEIILGSQRVGPSEGTESDSGQNVPRLQVILTSSVAVEILHAALDAAKAAERPRATYDPMRTAVLTIEGCGTAQACAARPAFRNVTFCGKQLRDIYTHLDAQPPSLRGHIQTVVLGVATGGDRSYRTNPTLSGWIEELGVYESAEVSSAAASVRQTLSWLGPDGGDLMVTSSKSATVLARAVNEDLQSNATQQDDAKLRHLRVIAQGPSTAATLRRTLEGGNAVEILTPAAPNIEAIAELLRHEKSTGREEPAKKQFELNAHAPTYRFNSGAAETTRERLIQGRDGAPHADAALAAKHEDPADSSMRYTIGVIGLVAVAILVWSLVYWPHRIAY